MKDICKFLVEHWELFLGTFLALCSLIFSLLKKRPSADSLTYILNRYVTERLAHDMQAAEMMYLDGSKKKLYVIERCLDYFASKIQLDDYSIKSIKSNISLIIENALSVPEKKDK